MQEQLQPQPQIPPLRCGMTSKKTGNDKQKNRQRQTKEQATTNKRTGDDTSDYTDGLVNGSW
jgi:hypothetical protein